MELINFEQMVKTLAKPGQQILDGANASSAHNNHMVVGIIGEICELIEAITLNAGISQVLEELGDIEFYMEGLRQNTGLYRNDFRPEVRSYIDLMQRLIIAGGNVVDTVKKEFIYGQNLDHDRLQSHLNDVDACLASIYARRGVTRDAAIQANIAKLGERYRGFQYTDAAAEARADKA